MKEIIQVIEKDFKRKAEAGPGLSLRSYADFLGISKSTLSKILNGDGHLTPKVFEAIAPKLNLSPEQCADILSKLKSNKKQKDIRNTQEDESIKLQMEEFNMISDWYHCAILYMCDIDDFQSNPKWIAKRLGFSDVSVIENAVNSSSLCVC